MDISKLKDPKLLKEESVKILLEEIRIELNLITKTLKQGLLDIIIEKTNKTESLQSELTKVKEERDSLIRWLEIHKNCENCRYEFDDKNSPCELCKDYLAWESNFGEIGRVTNED